MKFGPIMAAGCTVLVAVSAAQAQIRSKSSTDGAPCCSITAIDLTNAVATARDKAGKGKPFQFSVKDAALLRTLRVGQSVSADFGTGKVTVNGVTPCCAIVTVRADPAEPVGAKPRTPAEPISSVKSQVKPVDPINGAKSEVKPAEPTGAKDEVTSAQPCCAITAINAATGVVTAQMPSSRATFRFQVRDARLIGSLKVGQKVFADFTTSKVRIHGSEPCCNIITY